MEIKTMPTVFDRVLGERAARRVCARLGELKYDTTIAHCRGKSPNELALYFYPLDEEQEQRRALAVTIAEAAGFRPASE